MNTYKENHLSILKRMRDDADQLRYEINLTVHQAEAREDIKYRLGSIKDRLKKIQDGLGGLEKMK